MKICKKITITLLLVLSLAFGGVMTMNSSDAFAKNSTMEDVIKDTDVVETNADKDTPENNKVSDYVKIKKKKSPMGIVEYPVFLKEKLDATDVKKVNKLFNAIKKDKWKSIKEMVKTHEENDENTDSYHNYYLMKTEVRMCDDLISVLVIYGDHFSSVKWIEAVNFNLETGRLMSPNQVLKKFGYTKKAVNKEIHSHCRAYLTGVYETLKNYAVANGEKYSMSKNEVLNYAKEIDSINYNKYYYNKFVKKFKIPRYPAVFVDEIKNLYVGAAVPIIAGAGFSIDLIPMGHSYGERMRAKADNLKNATIVEKTLSKTAAMDKIAEIYKAEGKAISLMTEGKKLLENKHDETYEPAFVIKAFHDGKDSIATDSYWSVGMESGTIWKINAVNGEWELYSEPDNDIFKNKILKSLKEKNSTVAICTNPSKYRIWVQKPIANFNLCKSVTSNTKDKNRFLLYASKDGLEIEIQTGIIEADEFKGEETKDKIILKKSECIAITTYSDDLEIKAIVVKDKDVVKTYILTGKEASKLPKTMEVIYQ